jgi:two-component system NtrC family sensor kinase
VLSNWPIRVKLLVGLGLLLLLVVILAGSGLYTTYAYRDLVKSLSWRVPELRLAAELSEQVGELRITLSELRGLHERHARGDLTALESDSFPSAADLMPSTRFWAVREEFRLQLNQVDATLAAYRGQLEDQAQFHRRITDNEQEWGTVHQIEAALAQVREADRDQQWIFNGPRIERLDTDLADLQDLTAELPSHLRARLEGFASEVRGQYRTLIIGTWVATVAAGLVLAVFVRLFYRWVFIPLRVLVGGSRLVAAGHFGHRIHLDTCDEMAELAEAMNDMTARFQAIRDDLDRQVRERTKQVVRSEQLASVGFLAAGVAHEINNPLASIAMCAESLEGRICELLAPAAEGDERQVIANYLEMIQNEAFRCKEITERLLDFSRMGNTRRQHTELGDLVQGVVDMVGHLGRYQRKHIEFPRAAPVVASINPQEIKQVVLNLLTNALDSLDDDGTVRIRVEQRGDTAELVFADDGCGMEPEVLEHVFEPFFTRRRAGQGTGLGLSITYRIVADHGGEIEAESPGPGRGATFRVRLPASRAEEAAPTESPARAA